MTRLCKLAILFALLLSSVLMAGVPQLISYQGRVTDSNDDPVPNGDYAIIFSLYDVETGGVPFWAETLSTVGVQNGLFSVALGATNPFGGPGPNRAESDAWLGIAVGSDPELFPRTQLLSVPYAFNADRADTSQFAYQSQHSQLSDTAFYTDHSVSSDTSYVTMSVLPGSIGSTEIAAGAVNNTHLQDQSVDGNKIADDAVSTSKIQWDAVTSQHILDSTITGDDIADSTIGGVKIYPNSIFDQQIGQNAIGASELRQDAVLTANIKDGEIQLQDLSSFGATDGQILKWNNTLSNWQTVDETTGAGDITAVNAGSGLTGGGTSGDVLLSIPTGGVNSTHIQDSSIANVDIATDAITSDKIAYLTITGMDIATGAISNAKILDGTIVSQDIADGQVLTADIGTIQVTNEKLYPNAVTTDKIANLTITNSDISLSAAIDASKISGIPTLSGPNTFLGNDTFEGSNSFTGATTTFDGKVGFGVDPPNDTSRIHVAGAFEKYAGYFTATSLFGDSHVIHAEYTGTSMSGPVAVYGKSAPSDYFGVGGSFVGGRKGVIGIVRPSGSFNYSGVQGQVIGGTGYNYGVYGAADSGSFNYGVYGWSPGGYAGYFSGDVVITGVLIGGAGSVRIDHPLDPENKYLYHGFVESPDMMNVYNGNVELDASGEAWIELPKWFEALNKEFRYQLTCIGGFAPVYVAAEVSDNRFRVAGGTAGMKISWQVTGIRKDAYAEANRIQVEVDKTADERGLYLHPEAIGLDETMSIDYKHRPKDASE